MAISITWPTPGNSFVGTIFVPKADTTSDGTTPSGYELRTLDVNFLRGEVGTLFAAVEGGYAYDPYVHNREVTVAGLVLGRVVSFRYLIEFENGTYDVRITGGNHNIRDVRVGNSVSLTTENSPGLINNPATEQAVVQAALDAQGYTTLRAGLLDNLDAAITSRAAPGDAMALTPSERTTLVTALLAGVLPGGDTLADTLDLIRKIHTNRLDATPGDPGSLTLYDDDAVSVLRTWTLRDYQSNAVLGAVGSPALRGASS